MKFSKVIGVIIALVQLASAVGLVLGMYSMLGVYVTALPSGEEGIEIEFNDPVVVPFQMNPRNSGYLEAQMVVSVSMIVDGVEVATDSASVNIPAGSSVPIDLELSVPLADAQEYFQEATSLQWETDIRVSTLFDLISFSNQMVIDGGVQ